jgi:hypothetical protein
MKSDGLVYGVLGLFGLLYLYSRTDQGSQTISDLEAGIVNLPSGARGIRNNNPGNVRKSNTPWLGLAPQQTDPEFFQFVDMAHGVRTIAMILETYSTKYGLDTVSGIVNRWAPPSENDTVAYVSAVASSAGVAPDDPLDLTDADTMFSLVRAIIAHENGGIAAALIPDSTVRDGIALAGL